MYADDPIAAGRYLAARSMKVLWRARSHDLDSWRKTIEWMTPPDAAWAWEKLPSETKPYRTARAFIQAEVHPDYDKLLAYVEIMLGIEWAKRIADNYADKPGGNNNPSGHNQYNSDGQPYAHKVDREDETQYGTSKAYLLERLPPDVVAEIGGTSKDYTCARLKRQAALRLAWQLRMMRPAQIVIT